MISSAAENFFYSDGSCLEYADDMPGMKAEGILWVFVSLSEYIKKQVNVPMGQIHKKPTTTAPL